MTASKLKNVTVEMSLKPFKTTSETAIAAVCETVFMQWYSLIKNADMVSVLLWTADGSEILDYRGSMDDEIEWARYIGGANRRAMVNKKNDPDGLGLHSRNYLYTENPPAITYATLKKIVGSLKAIGARITGKPVRVGETFDPGPEFAKSPFKYERHNEICMGKRHGYTSFVCCYGELNQDSIAYAGFPDGIPQGTPFGLFFGRQCRHFLADLDFDYIWFSNGFGFGRDNWGSIGALFDGKEFRPEMYAEIRSKIVQFWKLFREQCPNFAVETRGTNLATGIDLASDGVPAADIYRGGYDMLPPPNSPWAALNGDFGIELAGYMSRIAEIPAADFPFRYYVHDPWWMNSPWLDRYGREPHDIYLPLSISRVDENGDTISPTHIQFLTIDNSLGEMPDKCPREVIPHILAGIEDRPDSAAPLVWVYPFDEYHEWMAAGGGRIGEVFCGDWLMRGAINNGLPLSTVVSTQNVIASLNDKPAAFRESVLVSILPEADSAYETALLDWIERGGRVLFYGPALYGSPRVLDLLNIALAEPLAGELALSLADDPDELSEGSYPGTINHRALFSGGGIRAVQKNGVADGPEVFATVSNDAMKRIVAAYRNMTTDGAGEVAWVRGTVSGRYVDGNNLLVPDDPVSCFIGELLLRAVLQKFGYRLVFQKKSAQIRNPITMISRSANGFFFSGYTPSTTVSVKLRFPQGAPILLGYETELEGCHSVYSMPRAWHRECRVFVDQQQDSVLSCIEVRSSSYTYRRRMQVSGLIDATVRFYPVTGYAQQTQVLLNAVYPWMVGDVVSVQPKNDAMGSYIEVQGATGRLLFSW